MCFRILEQSQVNIHNCFCGLNCNEAIDFRQFCRGPCVCVLLPMPVNQRNDFMGIAKHIGRSSASTCYGNCAITGTFTGCCEIQSRTKYQGKNRQDIYKSYCNFSISVESTAYPSPCAIFLIPSNGLISNKWRG